MPPPAEAPGAVGVHAQEAVCEESLCGLRLSVYGRRWIVPSGLLQEPPMPPPVEAPAAIGVHVQEAMCQESLHV